MGSVGRCRASLPTLLKIAATGAFRLKMRAALRQTHKAQCGIVLMLAAISATSLTVTRADAAATLSIPRARSYLAAELRAEWKRDTVAMKQCWRISSRQVNCNARINGSTPTSYCLTTAAAVLLHSGRLAHRTVALHCHMPPLVVPPIKPPSPLPSEYPGATGYGHSIESVSLGAPTLVTLEDGSVWKIEAADELKAQTWSAGDPVWISTYGYSRYPNYPYLLEDRSQQTSAAARYLRNG